MDLGEAAAFIEALPTFRSSQEVGDALMTTLAPQGFLGVASGLAYDTPKGRDGAFFFNTWPKDWLRVYMERDYARHDPAPALARLSAEPFTWLEVAEGPSRADGERAFLAWFGTLGIVDGSDRADPSAGRRPRAVRRPRQPPDRRH